jgi:hypothetical protein
MKFKVMLGNALKFHQPVLREAPKTFNAVDMVSVAG